MTCSRISHQQHQQTMDATQHTSPALIRHTLHRPNLKKLMARPAVGKRLSFQPLQKHHLFRLPARQLQQPAYPAASVTQCSRCYTTKSFPFGSCSLNTSSRLTPPANHRSTHSRASRNLWKLSSRILFRQGPDFVNSC